MASQPVYSFPVESDDPFTDQVLDVLFTDAPERPETDPENNRQHWQHWADSPRGRTSRGWRSFAKPLTEDVPPLLERRYQTALETAFVPEYGDQVEVTVRQTRVNQLSIAWVLSRSRNQVVTGGVLVSTVAGS